jgi:hypothetical protein
MTAEELKDFLGLKYNKILEINLKQTEKVLYGKLKEISPLRKNKASKEKEYLLNFDIIKDVDGFRAHRENRKYLKPLDMTPEDIDSIGVVEL